MRFSKWPCMVFWHLQTILNWLIRKFHQFCNYESTISFHENECCYLHSQYIRINKQTQFFRKICRFIVYRKFVKTCDELLFFPNNYRIEFSILVHCALFKLGFDFDGAEESPTFCCWFLLLLFPGKLKGRLPAPPLEFPAVPEPPGSISGRNFGFFLVDFLPKSAKFSSLSSFSSQR